MSRFYNLVGRNLIDIRYQFCYSKYFYSKSLGKKCVTFQELKSEEEYEAFQSQVKDLENKIKKQGDIVRELKQLKTSSSKIKEEVEILKSYKKDLELHTSKFSGSEPLDKDGMDKLIKKRFYFDYAFDIYGGVAGQYDYGPVGTILLENILSEWKKHFVVRDRMMMLNSSVITPEAVFKTSGHLDRFTDYMVKDDSGEMYRLDHLIKEKLTERLNGNQLAKEEEEKNQIKEVLENIDNMELDDLMKLMKTWDVKSPKTGKSFEGEASQFNLMFPVHLGVAATKSYLKPEHTQGIVLNFKKLLELNEEKLPLACAQVGLAFRNEVSPKQKVLRVREFVLAEIAHFCYADSKSHPKFRRVSGTKLWLLPACRQKEGQLPLFMSVSEAVQSGIVGSETLGYYLAQTQLFLTKMGLVPRRVRFRQHSTNQMAHYASDCWDAEVLTSFGWVEVAGCADRGCYDISQHSEKTGVSMKIIRPLSKPRKEDEASIKFNNKSIKQIFKEDANRVLEILNKLNSDEMIKINTKLDENGEYEICGVKITREMVQEVEKENEWIWCEDKDLCLIEPSFGIGRIFYCLLEHTFRIREGNEYRPYFALPPPLAPYKVAVLPLYKNFAIQDVVEELTEALVEEDVSVWPCKSTHTIGRRYVGMDELSVPLCITVDEETLRKSPRTVTLRDRETTKQIRIPITEVVPTIKQFCEGKLTWNCLLQKWPIFSSENS